MQLRVTRRFTPPSGFLCGAAYCEVAPGKPGVLVWKDGTRVIDRKLTLARAERYVRRRLWLELPHGE